MQLLFINIVYTNCLTSVRTTLDLGSYEIIQKLNVFSFVMLNMKTRVILRYFGTYCLWKRFLDYKSPNTPSILICLKFLVTASAFKLFQPKIRAIKLERKSENLPYLRIAFPIFSLRMKFGIRRISNLFQDVFQKDKESSS